MKKIFTLFFALLAFAFCAKAQVPVFSENFDSGMPTGWTQIDANNDNMGWEHSSNPASYFAAGTDLSGTGHNGSTGFMLSGSYSNVTSQAITPDNWLISPAISLTSNSNLSFYVCAQDANYAGEHYGVYISTGSGTTTSEFTLLFEETIDANGGSRAQGTWKQKTYNLASYTGQTVHIAFRHFNCNDMFVFNLDDVEILAQPTDPTIVAASSSINFGTVQLGATQSATVLVSAYNLTAGVTATTAAPFSVSADGTTYGTTATLAAAGGTLYVKYTPTTIGTDNGTVTLASTGATNVTLSLTGSGISCTVTNFPYSFEFDDAGMADCWDVIDANNDGSTFTVATSSGYAYYTYNTTNPANDWLISPQFVLTGNEMASFDYWCSSSSWPEKFMVYALGSDTVLLVDTVTVTNSSSAPVTQYLALNALTGTYRIGIRCVSEEDQFRLYIDNFSVFSAGTANLTVNPNSIDFGVLPVGSTGNSTFDLTILNASANITVSTTAPFTVSLDNSTFATSVTIPTPSSAVASQTIYVAYNPTTAGAHNGQVSISTTGATQTVTLAGTGVECNVITTFPFSETFLETSTTVPCWQIVDHNNDGNTFIMNTSAGQVVYSYSSTNAADEYLISPEMTLGTNFFGHVDYACASSSYPERFSVYVIPANGTIDNAINIVPSVNVTNTSFETLNFGLAAYANQTIRIAIKAESDADMYLLGFTNFVVQEMPAASIVVDPTSMSFSGVAGNTTSAQTANVTAYSLTSNITVSTTAPFEVSTNGTSFGATASIPASDIVNSMIYVRYAPTTTGTHNGTVTLTSGSITATINVTGTAMDCSQGQTLPFFEGFENELTECWTILDEDGDGYSWENYGMEAYDGDGCISSASYINNVGALEPDNWLITPALSIPSQGANLTFYVVAQDASYAEEHYGVYVSTSGTAPSNFTLLYEEDLDADGGPRDQGTWKQKQVNLPYGGQTIRLAIRHFNVTDMFFINIDNLNVTAGVGVENHDGMNTKVYPNPANNVLNINATCNINRIEVYNVMGQMVGMYEANDVNAQINTTAFANGVYTVKIATENGTTTKKFTVAR